VQVPGTKFALKYQEGSEVLGRCLGAHKILKDPIEIGPIARDKACTIPDRFFQSRESFFTKTTIFYKT
jgi:hypothetical protein